MGRAGSTPKRLSSSLTLCSTTSILCRAVPIFESYLGARLKGVRSFFGVVEMLRVARDDGFNDSAHARSGLYIGVGA